MNEKKYKHQETIDGYFSIDLDDDIVSKSRLFDLYSVDIDSDNLVHGIVAMMQTGSFDDCKESSLKGLKDIVEGKYSVRLEKWENYDDPTYRQIQYYAWQSDSQVRVQCIHWASESEAWLEIIVQSTEIFEAIEKYYKQTL